MKENPIVVGARYRCTDPSCGFEVVVSIPPRCSALLPSFECCARPMRRVSEEQGNGEGSVAPFRRLDAYG
jgi:hypothetical protein